MASFNSNDIHQNFRDRSTECALCLEPFEDASGDKNTMKPIITLRCGHKWHLDCIIEQIKFGSMTTQNDDQRLLFSGCQCAKCGTIFGEGDHPDLPKDLIRSTDKLRSEVYALVDKLQLLPCLSKEGDPTSVTKENLYKEALRKHAFYLCIQCKKPYYGGTIECADQFSGSSTPKESKLCPTCAPASQSACRSQNPAEHGPFLKWKCRYCCRPSRYVCYGNVHFCDDCHERNSVANRSLPPGTTERPALEGIPCSGDSCKYPKPEGCTRHSNGPTQDCEQVYACVMCESNPNHGARSNIPTGSRNLIINPSGQQGLEGWTQMSYMSWRVEQRQEGAHIPPLRSIGTPGGGEQITTNFVSTFQDCCMGQTIDLRKYLRIGARRRQPRGTSNEAPPMVRVEVAAMYTGRTDCPSVFSLQTFLGRPNDPMQRQLRFSTGVLEAPPGLYWERASLTINIGTLQEIEREDYPSTLTVLVLGKDRRFWQGNYGSKAADICVRILGDTQEDIDGILLTPEEIAQEGAAVSDEAREQSVPRTTVVGPPVSNNNGGANYHPDDPPPQKRSLLWDFVIPMFGFLLMMFWGRSNRDGNPD